MTRTASPLRYPGGKSALHNLVGSIIYANRLDGGHYAEPFAGGGGLALSLLFGGIVREIHLNDIDPAIAALWRTILERNDEICAMIETTPVTIEQWHDQKKIHARLLEQQGQGPGKTREHPLKQHDDLQLGFATLFLNRTNRSGIIKNAGVIGGLRQTGTYLLDCRFNKANLIQKIKRISRYRDRIHFSQSDAIKFLPELEKILPTNSFICADPPYYKKGKFLYTSFYHPEDHSVLARSILELTRPWIITYDNCPEISRIYKSRRQYEFSVQYSTQTKRLDTERLIVSKGMRLPSDLPLTKVNQPGRTA